MYSFHATKTLTSSSLSRLIGGSRSSDLPDQYHTLKDLEISQEAKRKRWIGADQERYELSVHERKTSNTGSSQSPSHNASRSREQQETHQNLCDAKRRADSCFLDWIKDEEQMREQKRQSTLSKRSPKRAEYHSTQHHPIRATSWVSSYMDQPMRGKEDGVHANRSHIGRALSNGFQHHIISS